MPYRDTCLSLGRLTATSMQCTDSFQNLVVPCPVRVPTITEQWTKWAVQKVLLCVWNVFRTIPLFWRSLSSPTKASGALYPTWSPCTTELITTITKKNQWLTNSSQLKTCFQSPRKFTSTPSEGQGIAVMSQRRMKSMDYFLFTQSCTSSPSPCTPLMHLKKYLWVLIQILQLINLISHSLG